MEKVDAAQWDAAQPKPLASPTRPTHRGAAAKIDEKTGRVVGALEGEELTVVKVSAGKTSTQSMSGFRKGQWSGGKQLFWSGAKPGATLDVEFDAAKAGTVNLAAAFTMARDYATVQLHLDGKRIGDPLDLYHYPDVVHSGTVDLGSHELGAGKHRLTIEIVGANAAATKAYMCGIDYVLLRRK